MGERILQFRLTRHDSSTQWGFRLEGGTDIGHALVISKVLPNSVADMSGLRTGDKVICINKSNTQWMKHEDAKMEIIRSSNDIDFTVQRGGPAVIIPSHTNDQYLQASPSPRSPVQQPTQSFWSPKVTSNAHLSPSGHASNSDGYAYNLESHDQGPLNQSIGVSHNVAPPPFNANAPVPGQQLVTKSLDGRVKKIEHSSYNTPMGLYSKQNVNSQFSNVMNKANFTSNASGGAPASSGMPVSAMSSMKCGACGDFIKGVFVKVQGRVPMHPSCLKCCKCNIGLANVGYFFINNKLYCETHAKQVAAPPEPGMKAVAVYK